MIFPLIFIGLLVKRLKVFTQTLSLNPFRKKDEGYVIKLKGENIGPLNGQKEGIREYTELVGCLSGLLSKCVVCMCARMALLVHMHVPHTLG